MTKFPDFKFTGLFGFMSLHCKNGSTKSPKQCFSNVLVSYVAITDDLSLFFFSRTQTGRRSQVNAAHVVNLLHVTNMLYLIKRWWIEP